MINFSSLVEYLKTSITELREINSILTDISKSPNFTTKDLKKLAYDSFGIAGKYGKKSADYLLSVQTMTENGVYNEKASAMAEQSLLAQASGNLSQEIADKYILAADAAYKFNGEAEKLNAVLDGTNSIAFKNNIHMADIAEAMSLLSAQASKTGTSINELSAITATTLATTESSGTEAATAWSTLFSNLQNISSENILNTLDNVNISMTETSDGIEKLRKPVKILKDLAEIYNSPNTKPSVKEKITNSIGTTDYADILDAFLSNFSLYENMLNDYDNSAGFAMEQAMKGANNLYSSLNNISNTWNKIINNITDTDSVTSTLKGFNYILNVVEKLTCACEKFGSVLSTIGLTYINQKKGGGLIKQYCNSSILSFPSHRRVSSDAYEF